MYPWMRTWVPGRHRALLGRLLLQTQRSTAGSQCERQVTQLLVLLRDEGPMRTNECIAVLDGEDERWLTGRRSHALVDATLGEAFIRAWYDPRTPLERESMRQVVDRLEALESYIMREFAVDRPEETLERELLLHMGRGMEVLRWDEKKRQAPTIRKSASSSSSRYTAAS